MVQGIPELVQLAFKARAGFACVDKNGKNTVFFTGPLLLPVPLFGPLRALSSTSEALHRSFFVRSACGGWGQSGP